MTTALFIVTLTWAYFAAVAMIRSRAFEHIEWRALWPVMLVFIVTAIVNGAQFVEPAILHDLERNRAALEAGEVWRIATPLFVQDGGGAGTVSNLATFILLGIPAALLFGARRWLVVYFGGGILSEVAAYTVYHQGSAGNSIANFGVAALIAVAALQTRHRLASIFGGLALAGGLALFLAGNLHGVAFLIGGGIALVMLNVHRAGKG